MKNTVSIFDRLMGTCKDASINNATLKDIVIRDLLNLLNTTCYFTDSNSNFNNSYIYQSVLNYGIHPLAGKCASEINWLMVEDGIKSAIRAFEPRIQTDSLVVHCHTKDLAHTTYNRVNIEISGVILASPHPERFILQTNLDLETGNFELA